MQKFPFHLSLVMNNVSGFYFANRETGVAVQRLISLENFSEAMTLLDCMADEAAYSNTATVVVDLNQLPSDFSLVYCLALIRFCLGISTTTALVVVGYEESLATAAGMSEITAFAASRSIRLIFAKAADVALAELADGDDNLKLTPQVPAGFSGGYGGSVYTWPELLTVVTTLSGNAGDVGDPCQVLAAAFAASEKQKAQVLVIDTSEFQSFYDEEGADLVRAHLVKPALAGGLKQIVHVRPIGDTAMTGASTLNVRELLTAAGMEYIRVGTLQDAMAVLDRLQGITATHLSRSTNVH